MTLLFQISFSQDVQTFGTCTVQFSLRKPCRFSAITQAVVCAPILDCGQKNNNSRFTNSCCSPTLGWGLRAEGSVCGVSWSMGTWSVSSSISVSNGIDRFIVDCHSDSQSVWVISLFFESCIHVSYNTAAEWAIFYFIFFGLDLFLFLSFLDHETKNKFIFQLKSHLHTRLTLCQSWCNVVRMLLLCGSIKPILIPVRRSCSVKSAQSKQTESDSWCRGESGG